MAKVTNTQTFIAKAQEIHGHHYNYSKTVYKSSRDKAAPELRSFSILLRYSLGDFPPRILFVLANSGVLLTIEFHLTPTYKITASLF